MQDERNGKKSGGGGMSLRMAPLTSSFTSFASNPATATSASHHSSHSFSGVSLGGGGGTNSSSGGMEARTAIENSLRNLEKILDNEELFPSKYGEIFLLISTCLMKKNKKKTLYCLAL